VAAERLGDRLTGRQAVIVAAGEVP
jgi:hypothetical protein